MSPYCHILIWGISIYFMSHFHFRDDFLLYVVSGFLIPYCIGLSLNFSSWTEFLKGRHLDNLLLRDDGRLFHVDFGYILGRDPKPFPPPMKLCKEMVEAMGGAERFSPLSLSLCLKDNFSFKSFFLDNISIYMCVCARARVCVCVCALIDIS